MDIETAKENIQPLPRGRNIKALEMALNAEQSHALQSELMQQRKEYELSILSYEGDDPLELWFDYIHWIEQCYPKSGKESALEEVIAKCLATFETEEKYRQDRRMIKLYIKYIDAQQNPIDYYQELYNQGVGTRVADLYICWAHYYDANDNFEQTESIFRKGFDAHAEPLDDLKTAHKQFGFSMSQRILYKDDLSKQEFVSKMNEKRSALTSLRAHKHKFVGSLRTGIAIKNNEPGKFIMKSGESKENCNTANLNVYEDVGAASSDTMPQHVSIVKSIIDSARKQENLREPGLWTKKTKKHNEMFPNEQHQDFEILEDSEEIIPIKESCKLSGIILPENFARRNLKQPTWNVDLIIEEDSEPLKIPMYNKIFLYKKNMKKDYSMEHLRAYFWYKKNMVKNILTEEMDEHWSNTFDIGIRVPIMFYNKSVPQDTFNPNRYSEPFIQNDCLMLMTLYSELYPNNSIKEYSLEEILANRIKKGLKRINKPKNIVKNRHTQFVAIDMEETIIHQTNQKRIIYEDEETDISEIKNIDKRVERTNEIENDKFKNIQKLQRNESIKGNNFNDDLMLPPPMPPKFFENSEKNSKLFNPNDSCSTQSFNFFIKQTSISTPLKQTKVKYSLSPVESHDSMQQQQTNHQFDTVSIHQKQLSTIMETTETITISSASSGGSQGSTKSNVLSQITNDINTYPTTTIPDDILSTNPIKNYENKTEAVAKSHMIPNEKHITNDYMLPFNSKINAHQENTTLSTSPIQIFEDKTETIPKHSIRKQLKMHKEDSIAPSNSCNYEQNEDTTPSMRPIQIFEVRTDTVPNHLMSNNRKTNVQQEGTVPSMYPTQMFEDRAETIPKNSVGGQLIRHKEDSFAPPGHIKYMQNEDTAPSLRPIQIFEDKTDTVPKHLMSNNRKTNVQHEDTVPSMCPIEIFEDRTETIPKISVGGQLIRQKENSFALPGHIKYMQNEDTAPSLRPIQIFEDRTDTVPKHLMSNNHKTNVQLEDTVPSMRPIQIFEDRTDTVPKHLMSNNRKTNVQPENTVPSMCPIEIFEDRTDTVPKPLMSNSRKTNVQLEDTVHSMLPIEIFEDRTDTIPKISVGGQLIRQKENSFAPPGHKKYMQNEDTALSLRPIQIFENRTDTVPKHLMSNNHKTNVQLEDTVPSMRPIQIFEDRTDTVPKHLMSNNRKTNVQPENTVPSMCPIEIFEDRTDTVPKPLMSNSRKTNVQLEDTVHSMLPIEIFEDRTDTIPKISVGGQLIRQKENSFAFPGHIKYMQNEDTAPSLRPIQIFEDRTDTVPKHLMSNNRKTNVQHEDTVPTMCPIEIFEDRTETIPKISVGGQLIRQKENSFALPGHIKYMQNEDTAPSLRPIQIFEDRADTVPKHLMSNNRKTNVQHEDTVPSMCPIEIFEDRTETMLKIFMGGQLIRQKEDSFAPSDHTKFMQNEDTAPSMRPIQLFEDKTDTVPKHLMSNNGKTNVQHENTVPSMCPIEIFEDRTDTIPKHLMSNNLKTNLQLEGTVPSMRPMQIFEDRIKTSDRPYISGGSQVLRQNEDSFAPSGRRTDNLTPEKDRKVNSLKKNETRKTIVNKEINHFFDMFTKTPSKNLGAIPKVKECNATSNVLNDDIIAKPKIFEFVKCDKSRFTDYNNSVISINDPLSIKSVSNLESKNNIFNGKEIDVSISFTQSEHYDNLKQKMNFSDQESEDENMYDVDKEDDIMGQSIYITNVEKLNKEKELLTICHNWVEIEDDNASDRNNIYMHNENNNFNITTQMIEEKLNNNPYIDPNDPELLNSFLENIDFINYLHNLDSCTLVNKLYPLKVSNTVNVNDKFFIIQKIIGKGAYGTIFSGKCQQTGELYAFKQERPANLFEYYICLELHSRLTSLAIKKAFMNIEYSLIGNNASILISKLSKYGSLINVCNVIKEKTMHNIDEYIVMMLSSQLLLAVDHLHSCNIIHGDIKPDNILLMSQLIYGDYDPIIKFIDFGRGIDMQLFPKNTTFNVKLLTDNFICPEMLDGRPWTYQHDLFCLASTIYVLLFGRYMIIEKKQCRWKINPNIPRYYKKTVWDNFFDKLLNIPSCNQLPNLQELRDTFKEEIILKEKYIKEKINQFNNAFTNI